MTKYNFAVALSAALFVISIQSGFSLFIILACLTLLVATNFLTYREIKARKIMTATSGVPKVTDSIEVKDQSKSLAQHSCGHTGPKTFVISLYGEDTTELDQDEPCPNCVVQQMKELIIRCARCGLGILPGEPVAGYDTSNSGLRLKIATEIDKGYVAGCMRWDCCPSGAFYYGHWTGKEFQSAFGGKTMAEECFESGKSIFVSLDE